MTSGDQVDYESVFRERWRTLQSSAARPGELIRQPRWVDAGLALLAVLCAAGAVAAATVSIERSAALPATAQGTSVTAIRSGDAVPAQGATVQYRNTSGATVDAVVVDVTDTEVRATVTRPGPVSAGELVFPAGRQRLISVLVPSTG